MPTPKATTARITHAEPTPKPRKTEHPEKPSYFRELTAIQIQAAELAADLIMNGGAHDDVSGLLYNLLAHRYRRITPDLSVLGPHFVEHAWEEWYRDLSKHWPEKISLPARPNPTEVVEMARENARRRLESIFFDDFMGSASPEDVYFLREILENCHNVGMSLPAAFAFETTSNSTYVSVPYKHVKLVEKYVELLAEGDEARDNAA